MRPPFRPRFQRRPKREEPDRGRRCSQIKASAESGLKKVFAGIGVPPRTPFTPDPFQLEALEAVRVGDCLVTAPTGAGKTWIAQEAISRMLAMGRRSWYASPLKALSNSIFALFAARFGPERVGILTGDRKENPDAPLVVGTTEILRNQLYDAMHRGGTLEADLVVLDEAHFLGDPERGVVWEETLIYLPTRIPILMLSATVGNAGRIAEWLEEIRGRPCAVVAATRRPVPLFGLFLHPTGRLMPLMAAARDGRRAGLSPKVRAYLKDRPPQLMAPPNRLPPFGEILAVLRTFNLLPAIFFLKSRADCNHAIELCRGNRCADPWTDALRRRRVEELTAQSLHIAQHRQRDHLEHWAVGAHHAGQLPAWKVVLETLMNEGLLDAVFATSTVAAGVNFPARTVVFMNTDRFNGTDFAPLDPTEFHQMTGRAGRRGKDNIGFALALPGKYMDLRLAGTLMVAPASDVPSRIHVNFSMVLNLLLSHGPEQIEELLARSFAAHCLRGARKKAGNRWSEPDAATLLTAQFRNHLAFLVESAFVGADGRLTEDGLWASRLRVDRPLLIAEGFRRQAFPASDPALLAAVVASLVSEKEEDRPLEPRTGPALLAGAWNRFDRALRPFRRRLVERGFQDRPLLFRPAATVYRWLQGRPWQEVIEAGGIEEGDLVMLVLRTADHLRHIRALKPFFPEVAETARVAVERMLREPVVTTYGEPRTDARGQTESGPES